MDEMTPKSTHFPTKKREILMLVGIMISCVLMADSIIYGGFHLGFALTCAAASIFSFLYLRRNGRKSDVYATALFLLNLIISLSFLRSDDGFVKFVMVCFLLIGGNLSLVLSAGQNRRKPGGILSLLDAPMAVFTFGFGQLSNALGGLNDARKNAGTAGKKNMAVLAGLAIAVPVMAVLIPLLIRSDAAFEGLVNLLPKTDLSEPLLALLLGIPLACILYSRNASLIHRPKQDNATWSPRKFSSLTVNTVLLCVCLLYCVYLASQLAYFVGGFAGILPDGFTLADYARRGFFEMTWLAAINLAIIVTTAALTEPKNGLLPRFTKALCLFIGFITLFFAVTASAKMFLYIGSYGLTRLRLLVQVIITFIAFTVIFVAIWLCKPKFSYMKAVLITAMILGAAVAWTDVDTVVAAYNVGAYQSGKLETIDVHHLTSLGDGAVPHLQKLTSDPTVSDVAKKELIQRSRHQNKDLRSWNIASSNAAKILKDYQPEASQIDAVANCPLLPLLDYTDAQYGAQALMGQFGEFPVSGKVITFIQKDGALYYPDGEPYAECPFGYETLRIMDKCGVSSIEVCEYYVLFQTDASQTSALLWTSEPEGAANSLSQRFEDVALHYAFEQWHVVTMGGSK